MVVANRVIGRSDRFQRRLSSQEGRAMAGTSRVNREVYARFCGRLEVKFLRPTRRLGTPSSGSSAVEILLRSAGVAPSVFKHWRRTVSMFAPRSSPFVYEKPHYPLL